MCGITGIISNSQINSVVELVKMNQIISHRGPDDEGYVLFTNKEIIVAGGRDTAPSSWQAESPYLPKIEIDKVENADVSVAFAHRRLSILDLSPFGHQPMSYLNNRYWIVLNGEIYNYLELREELKSKGHTLISESDTEVVLAAYHEWGIECQHKFVGMWAFVIYDFENRELFFSRDRFGIKPLYYWFSPIGDLHFGSEIKQFTVLNNWSAKLNHQRAYDYLMHSVTDHTEETMFEGVYQVAPGHFFTLLVGELNKYEKKIETKRWYDTKYEEFEGSFDEAKSKFLELFKSSVELHLRSDVPVGSALSGGLDSSSIVCYVNILLKNGGKEELQKTFSSCSTDERFDERKWMDEVVKHTNVDAHFLYPKGEDVFKMTEKLLWYHDEPYQSQSAFLGYHVFESAKQNGTVVLLNGQGADEYLSGYGMYQFYRQRKLFIKFKLRKLMSELAGETFAGKAIKISELVLYSNLIPETLKDILRKNKSSTKRFLKTIDPAFFKSLYRYKNPPDIWKHYFDISKYQMSHDPLPRYLKWEDRNSMANSTEARVPFLDHRLVEFTMNLPVEFLDTKDVRKRILVSALKGILPEKVRTRDDKKGFITPEQRWFMEDFKGEFIDYYLKYADYSSGIINKENTIKYLLDVQNKKIAFSYNYWRLISFSIWMKVYHVNA